MNNKKTLGEHQPYLKHNPFFKSLLFFRLIINGGNK
jgi:hypothetical protein